MREAKEVVDMVADFLNVFGDSKRIQEFVSEMESQHRTLQQSFTRLCMAWLKRFILLRWLEKGQLKIIEEKKKRR